MMYLVVLCLFILNLKSSTSQFPNHMDLQKVGETIFNNEKYNILKPTTHIISDYFKDFVLRRDNVAFPTSRVFLDDNGFRHYWSGFDKKTKSLRKTEILLDAVETVTVKAEEITTNKTNDPNETHNSTEKVNSTDISGESNNSSEPSFRAKNTNSNSTATTNDVSEIKENTTDNKKPTNSSDGKVARISEGNDIKVYKHKKKETIISDNTVVSSNDVNLRGGAAAAASGKERTVAKTTFFCPYFGVITMSAFID